MWPFYGLLAAWRKHRARDASRVQHLTKSKRLVRPGDRWTDGSGRVHVLTVRDNDGNMTTDGVVL